jgi:rhodanese-related sulfurtransferase
MKNLLVFFAMVAALIACSSKKESVADKSTLSPVEFQDQFRPEAVIIDVRTPEEFEAGSLPNSLNIDFKNEAFMDNIRLLDKGKTYLVYCASGVRSGKALEQMKAEGFQHVYALEGGLEAWKQAGLPMD